MDWVEGVTLYEWVALHSLTFRQAASLLAQVARALEATHQHGVHRDVKGGNVLVSPEGHAVLVDYGCCWFPYAYPLTEASIPPGTPIYRSPQLLRFKHLHRGDPDARYEFQPSDDVYALGVTAYRLLAGTYPPQLADPEYAEDARRSRPERLAAPRGLAERCPELSALVLRMLSEEPADRGRAGELAGALERLAQQAGPAMDVVWVERTSLQTTEKAKRPGPPPWYAWRKLAPRFAFAVALAAMVLFGVLLTRSVDESAVAHREQEAQEDAREGPDADTVGMGNGAVASAVSPRGAPASSRGVAREVPERPLPGQKRPPCNKRAEAEIRGGCWLPIGGVDLPCDSGWYEHDGRCYAPFILTQRQPTSEDP
jgi:hypothetical protein